MRNLSLGKFNMFYLFLMVVGGGGSMVFPWFIHEVFPNR